ncbi:MAG: DPP IV N-terminal domain-containing protein [Prevotella sp.]|nr:DPP IV N-terminal domain-containing protein [Prevotella sp.]
MKKIVLLLSALFSVASGQAGQKLSLKDVTGTAFRAQSMAAVEAMADGETYAQISADGRQIVNYSFKTGKQTGVLFDAQTVRGAKIDRVDGYIVSPDGRHLLIQTQTKPIYRRSFTAVYYIYNVANNKMEPLSDGGPQQSPVWSPDGNQVAFVRDNNIFLVKLLFNNAESQLTKDGRRNEIINGIPDWVNEEEFSHNSSLVFTADSKQVVWIRYDETMVPMHTLPLSDYTYKYPRPGEQNATVQVMSYDIKSHQTRTMQLPLDADGYVPRIKSTNDPTKVLVFTLNRHQDCLRIFTANPMSTVCQQIIEDKVDKYINEDVFNQAKVTDAHLLLTSQRDGYNHIYLYGLNGQLKRQVTQGNYDVTDVYGFDEATGDVYYASHANGPTDVRVFVTHANGKTDCLSQRGGTNSAVFSSNFKYFVNTQSSLNSAPRYTLCTNTNKELVVLIDNQALTRKYNSYDMGTKELFTFTTGEGITLNGWMVKPKNFDASKKHPVVMYQYGGPGSQQVKDAWDIGMNGQGAILEQYLAQQGYVVVCVDGRGTGGRGAEFEKCTYLRLGELEARDQVEAAIWLGQQTYVDKERIGIWGWSYGGWNTLMSMSEGRPVFHCGIAIAPPTCWRYYDTVYTERFMRTPKENAGGYDDICPIARVSKLNGALLLCHGLADDNVHFENTAEYVKALVDADKDFRQLVYPGKNHSIRGGNTRNHLFRQCIDFFNDNLK